MPFWGYLYLEVKKGPNTCKTQSGNKLCGTSPCVYDTDYSDCTKIRKTAGAISLIHFRL